MERESDSYYNKFKSHIEKHLNVKNVEFETIFHFFEVKKVGKKTSLIEPGEICRFENFVVSGLFQTTVPDESGKIHTLNFPHENWWVGDFKSFSTQTPSNMRIEALEDSVLLEITKSSLDELLRSSPVFANYFRTLSENASIAANERIIYQLSQTAEQRYQLFCQKYPAIKNRLSQRRIASFLGVSPEYFNQLENRKKS